jgi:hypothetical protein
LPQPEREKLFQSFRNLEAGDIPADFLEALDDFAHGRFVPMEIEDVDVNSFDTKD